ncbi:hypothetical protein chiPu_0000448 [Chiloscyllium punctatum]|uniref:Uncharacterized protein n=1 Tax=Chiloscyllium punctatum TaxID=137246 RepID=A0A401RVC1_CHIPU|nr:hypothetical protein [Chiloscyllium punctatum]
MHSHFLWDHSFMCPEKWPVCLQQRVSQMRGDRARRDWVKREGDREREREGQCKKSASSMTGRRDGTRGRGFPFSSIPWFEVHAPAAESGSEENLDRHMHSQLSRLLHCYRCENAPSSRGAQSSLRS